MGYYSNVYLRRVNRFGTTLQERIINKKEYDFHNFVKKSPHRVTVFIDDYSYEGVLQTKEYNEIETIDYFLTYKSIKVPTGSILKILDIKDPNKYSYWIVICKDNFVSAGYDRYTVVKLDREVRWITDDGYLFKTLVHISGAGKSQSSKRITNTVYTKQNTEVFVPNQTLTMTLKDSAQIKRNLRTNIRGQVWKITGIDNISNDGVSYITLEQDYTDEIDNNYHLPTDDDVIEGIADGYKLDYWNFNTSLKEYEVEGLEYPLIKIKKGVEMPISFESFYFNEKTTEELEIINNNEDYFIYKEKERSIIGIKETEEPVYLTVRLKNYPDIQKTFAVEVNNTAVEEFTIEGPARLKLGIPTIVYSKKPFRVEENKLVKTNILDKSEEGFYRVQLTCSELGDITINFVSENDEKFSQTYPVESPWIGGY